MGWISDCQNDSYDDVQRWWMEKNKKEFVSNKNILKKKYTAVLIIVFYQKVQGRKENIQF